MIAIHSQLHPADLHEPLQRLWRLATSKILSIHQHAAEIGGTPVFTIDGRYVAQGWTEWTQGFQFGAPLLVFDATDDREMLELGRRNTARQMASHVTHIGVHDHGFNQVSTYGNLRRLLLAQRFSAPDEERKFYELALMASGAVQASRWTKTADGGGFIYSFNGPHSLFSDTMRSLRVLALAHQLGHVLWSENDRRISLLKRLIQHAQSTARYNVYFGEGRDVYDRAGRVAHESLFNTNDGQYRCPSTQQGYSPFTTWTRGLAWIMLGFAEQLEFLQSVHDADLKDCGGRETIEAELRRTLLATCDYYLAEMPSDGIPYWDTGAPGLTQLGDYRNRRADPFNAYEPVDSSAAAIAAQALLRAGRYLMGCDEPLAARYWQAGLTVAQTLLGPPYLCEDDRHQGLLLHVVYHRPRGWDHVPMGSQIPHGEACMWGDYHLLELGLYLHRQAHRLVDYTFFGTH